MPNCRTCGATIFWRRNLNSRQVAPIDELPTPDGNCLVGVETYGVLAGEYLAEARANKTPLHLNHWATCTKPPAKRPPQPAA